MNFLKEVKLMKRNMFRDYFNQTEVKSMINWFLGYFYINTFKRKNKNYCADITFNC